jgi:hypothetical protein
VNAFWADVEVEWIDGRKEIYQVGGYARRAEAVQFSDGVLTLWMGNNAARYEHVASIPLARVRYWKVTER